MAICNVTLNTFEGDILDSLMHFFIFNCYAVCLVGTLCNVVALWCVVGCRRTSPAVKVLQCALFSTTLLMCLLVMPFMAHLGISKVYCDRQLPLGVIRTMISLYIILTQMELLYITIMAFLRAVAVWSSTRRQLKMRTAVALMIGTGIYSTTMTMLLLVSIWNDILSENTILILALIYNSVNFFAPVVLTIACYLSMILAVRRSKHRLTATSDTAATGKVMDQATRAMLLVFISNLLLGLPHSIYHILPYDDHVLAYITVHIVFYAHLFVDPLAFMCSNVHHRQRVLQALVLPAMGQLQAAPALTHATSTLPLRITSSTTSSETRQEQI